MWRYGPGIAGLGPGVGPNTKGTRLPLAIEKNVEIVNNLLRNGLEQPRNYTRPI